MSDTDDNIRRGALKVGEKTAQVVVFVCMIALVGVFLGSQPESSGPLPALTPAQPTQVASPAIAATAVPTRSDPTPTPQPTLSPTPSVPRVGIVAGHWWLDESNEQSRDVGAVCDEGTAFQLTELEINLEVAQRVVFELGRAGYQVDLLQEWDERLNGYQADVLLSIHADACLYPEASGFKVARVTDSHVPEIEDRLVACLVERYGARTGLAFHAGSITHDMTQYHTFYEIDPNTPGAIIEVGFMLADRTLLTQRPDLVAQGIIDGILCFLEGEGRALE
jgi:N-acetylmuramoyl-L-alanine amidase